MQYGMPPMLPPQPMTTFNMPVGPVQPLPTPNPAVPLYQSQNQFDHYNPQPFNDTQRQHYLLP
jgi:hypothetical protein